MNPSSLTSDVHGQALAIHGGPKAVDRDLNLYKGAGLIGDEEKQAVMEVLDTQSLFRYYGPNHLGKVEAFEQGLADYLGVPFALGTANGTAALRLGLAALGVGPGDEVIVPAATFIASVGAIVASRARPVFCEVDANMLLDPEDLERCLTPLTKAIMPVHLGGKCADMDAVCDFARAHALKVIEDAAQAVGSVHRDRPVATIGDVGCFSFQLEKNITSGEGGALITSDPELYRRATIYSDQGGQFWTSHSGVRDHFKGLQADPIIGENLRMNEIAGAIMGCQLAKLPAVLDRIESTNGALRTGMEELAGASLEPRADGRDRHSVWVIDYADSAEEADERIEWLRAEGLPAGKIYGGVPVYAADQVLNQRLAARGCPFDCSAYFPEPVEYSMGMCPRSEDLMNRSIVLNVGPLWSEEDLDDVLTGAAKVYRATAGSG